MLTNSELFSAIVQGHMTTVDLEIISVIERKLVFILIHFSSVRVQSGVN